MKATDLNFVDTEAFNTLRGFYIAHHNEAVRSFARADNETNRVMRAKCDAMENTILILMGHQLDREDAREYVQGKFLRG
jgi:hypothetical protein